MTDAQLLDTDSEEEVPPGWQERVTSDRKVYYANHITKVTQWAHPVTGKVKTVSGELPYGWEQKVTEHGATYFIDHVNKRTTYTDPRLAFAEQTTTKSKNGEVRQRFDASSTAMQVLMGRDLSDLYVIITGANSGLGFESARSLAFHGAHVVLACRDPVKGAAAVKRIQKERPQAKVVAMTLDLASLASVKHFSNEYLSTKWPLHVLILNAGVFGLPYTKTDDGYEAIFQINYLGHFYLAVLLQSLLCESAPSRIVVVSAESHRFTDLKLSSMSRTFLSPPEEFYHAILSYNQSKLCCLLLSKQLHRRLSSKGVLCNAVHPGNVISTNLPRHSWFYRMLFFTLRPFTKNTQQGCATIVYCATARELDGVSGYYFNHCFQVDASDEACSKDTAAELWDISEVMVAQGKSLHGYPFT